MKKRYFHSKQLLDFDTQDDYIHYWRSQKSKMYSGVFLGVGIGFFFAGKGPVVATVAAGASIYGMITFIRGVVQGNIDISGFEIYEIF